MATSKVLPTQRAAWKALQSHYRDIRGRHLRHWFAEDPILNERPRPTGSSSVELRQSAR
jgi:hypothetical protein